jgi:hypothetical protein
MSRSRGIPHTLFFQLIRLLPLFSALGFVDLSNLSFEQSTLYFDRFLRACTVLFLWSMTEGVFMLWVREKNAGSEKTRGYGAVACILGLIVLVALQVFRAQASQSQFLILLAALAVRGMSRGGWEQGRPHISALAAPTAHTLMGLLSFSILLDIPTWQAALIGISVGLLTGAVETTWYAAAFRGAYPAWLLPLYRVSISFPAVAIGSLSLVRQLPPYYLASLTLLLVTTRYTWNQGRGGEISEKRWLHIAGIYLLFILLVAIAAFCS